MNLYSAVDAALTHEERAEFLDRVVELNPHLAGGSVADFLDMFTDGDSDLNQIEPFLERISESGPDVVQLHAVAARAAIQLNDGVLDEVKAIEIANRVLLTQPLQ